MLLAYCAWLCVFLGQMDKTMMYQTCQLQRLMSDYPIIEDCTSAMECQDEEVPVSSNKNEIKLEEENYQQLLDYVRKDAPGTRDFRELPHPLNARILQAWAVPKPFYRIAEKLLVSVMKPNNCIKYKEKGKSCYGIINQILEYKDYGSTVNTILRLYPVDNIYRQDSESVTHFFRNLCSLLKVVVGRLEENTVYISPHSVTSFAAYQSLPDDTFSILNRGIIIRTYDYDSHLSVD